MAPTEVLAEQHFAGITRLLADLKVPDDGNLFGERQLRVELLTGRITGERRRELLADLASGGIDIAIGTHALLAEGIRFKNLSLLIVDEEQHFGVKHKERLKEMKSEVHVLTLTATPIPRTLQLSLTGVRDLARRLLDAAPTAETGLIHADLVNENVLVHGADGDSGSQVAFGRLGSPAAFGLDIARFVRP